MINNPLPPRKDMPTRAETPQMLPVVERALQTDKTCRQFTGIPLYLFNMYMTGLKGKFLKDCKFSPHDQLCILFNMMKTNSCNTQLGTIFGGGEKLIGRVLKHMVKITFEFASRFIYWFSKEELSDNMFQTFRDSFPNTRCVIDGTEIKTQMPKSIHEAVLMWSSYKHAYTWKELVAIG